jgi:hypothetical protein
MKKILILCGLTTLILTSCVKSYSCKCVAVYDPSWGGGTETSTTIIHNKKSVAKAQCEGYSHSISGSYSMTCFLQ